MATSSPSPSELEPDNEIHPLVALKRRIAALEEENADLRVRGLPGKKRYVQCLKMRQNKLIKIQSSESNAYYGRPIRRLVCLTERVEDLVAEFNRRIGLGAVNESDADKMDSDDPE
jgi:hypothetical protein